MITTELLAEAPPLARRNFRSIKYYSPTLLLETQLDRGSGKVPYQDMPRLGASGGKSNRIKLRTNIENWPGCCDDKFGFQSSLVQDRRNRSILMSLDLIEEYST